MLPSTFRLSCPTAACGLNKRTESGRQIPCGPVDVPSDGEALCADCAELAFDRVGLLPSSYRFFELAILVKRYRDDGMAERYALGSLSFTRSNSASSCSATDSSNSNR